VKCECDPRTFAVYTNDGYESRLLRLKPGTRDVFVVPSKEIRAEPRAMRTVTAAAERLTTTVRHQVSFVVTISSWRLTTSRSKPSGRIASRRPTVSGVALPIPPWPGIWIAMFPLPINKPPIQPLRRMKTPSLKRPLLSRQISHRGRL